jgi:AcrR family transcriptional regulator
MSSTNQAKQEVNSTKDKIIYSAESLFLKFNYLSVTMDDIAGMLHISKPALYYHFKNKEDLFIEMAKDVFKDFSGALNEAITKDMPLEKKFKEVLRTYISFSLSKRDLAKLMMQKFSKKDNKLIKLMHGFKQAIIDQVDPLIKEIMVLKNFDKKIDSKLITLLLIGALNALVTSEIIIESNNWNADQISDQVTSMIFSDNKLKT